MADRRKCFYTKMKWSALFIFCDVGYGYETMHVMLIIIDIALKIIYAIDKLYRNWDIKILLHFAVLETSS